MSINIHISRLQRRIRCGVIKPLLLRTVRSIIISSVLPEIRPEPSVWLKPHCLTTETKSIATKLKQSNNLHATIIFLQSCRITHSHKNPNNPQAPKRKQIDIERSTNKRTHSPEP
jgi:hypothetical protein